MSEARKVCVCAGGGGGGGNLFWEVPREVHDFIIQLNSTF